MYKNALILDFHGDEVDIILREVWTDGAHEDKLTTNTLPAKHPVVQLAVDNVLNSPKYAVTVSRTDGEIDRIETALF